MIEDSEQRELPQTTNLENFAFFYQFIVFYFFCISLSFCASTGVRTTQCYHRSKHHCLNFPGFVILPSFF